MLPGMARMDLKRRLKVNRVLSAMMSALALIGWFVRVTSSCCLSSDSEDS